MSSLVNDAELDRQISDANARVAELVSELEKLRTRLNALHMIRNNAKMLANEFVEPSERETRNTLHLGGSIDPETVQLSTTEKSLLEQGSWMIDGVQEQLAVPAAIEPELPRRTKTPSTQMLANLVNESARSWTRDELHDGFKMRYGIPASWRNPSNAINNAIGRALEKKLIREIDGIYFSTLALRTSADTSVRSDDG